MSASKGLALVAVLLAATVSFAQKAALTLSSFPSISVADGHSTVTITAEVRDLNGSIVRDGTPVVFETNLGQFRQNSAVQTKNGFARAILTAPGVPGTAKIRANVFSLNASAVLEIDFVNDRSLLDTAKEFVEVTSNEKVVYSNNDRVVEASGKDFGAVVKYRDIIVKAAEVQFKPSTYELRARGAHLTLGKRTANFRELYIKLNQRRGFGIVSRIETVPVVERVGVGVSVTMKEHATLEAFDVTPTGVVPHEGDLNMSSLSFTDISNAVSTVEAKKAVVFPSRGIQFQRASVRLGGQSVMSVPLFQVDLNTSSPIITEQFLDVSNSSVAVNYPYYLSLKPGESSALRLRYGNRYSRGLGATGGTYLDYEYNWNQGAKMEGGLTVSGLARDDWGVGMRQFWQPNSETSVTAQVDVPAHRSIFSSLGVNRRFSGFQTNLNWQYGKSLSGDKFQSDSLGLNLDADPIAVGPELSLNVGLTAQQQRITGLASSSRQGAGLSARLDTRPLVLTRTDTLFVSYGATRWFGNDISAPLTQVASLNLSSNWFPGFFLQTAYEYSQDGFTEDVLGRHRLTMDGVFSSGRFAARSYVGKSLDLDRLSANFNLDYRFNRTWRLSAGYLFDRYAGETFLEQTLVLGYRLGFREIGLSYSTRTKRLGLELLGTRFD